MVIGPDAIIGAGVKIIGDSYGPVRIGARVQILANTVLHLLPDNVLTVEDDVVIGPGSIVWAGACVKQRGEFGELAVLDGFPAKQIGSLTAAPAKPAWAFTAESLATVARVHRPSAAGSAPE